MTEPFSAESRLVQAAAAGAPTVVDNTAATGLIRLSVGVEPAADLITDIDQALEVL